MSEQHLGSGVAGAEWHSRCDWEISSGGRQVRPGRAQKAFAFVLSEVRRRCRSLNRGVL